MTDDRSLERAARSWLEAGPTEAPDHVVEAALLQIQTTNQERDLHVPWRTRTMTQTTRLLAGATAIAVVLIGGVLLLRPGGNPGVGGQSSPSLSASPSASPAPASSPPISPSGSAYVVPALTQPFTSPRHGYSISVPSTWTVHAATAPWPAGVQAAGPPDPMLDVFTDAAAPTRSLVVVSQPLAKGMTTAAWLAAYEKSAPSLPAACWPAPDKMERTTINGQASWIHGGLPECAFTEAITFVGGRVYELSAYFPYGLAPMDRLLFDALLATVGLEPAAADDSRAASARPS